jgi:putative spermidine/putrescine transport system permease protein
VGWGGRLGRAALYVVCGAVFFYLIVPVLVVVPMSFSSSRYLQFPPPGLSLRWYANYLGDPEWTGATVRSLVVALVVTLVCTVVGTLAALGLVRGSFPGKQLVNGLIVSPMVVPVIIVAIALYFFYAPFKAWGFPLIGTVPGLVIAHCLLALPLVVINVSATLKGFDRHLEMASQNLGASPLVTFRRVTFPLIRPGVVSGALFAFITSFDELVIAIFISGSTARTLPVKMWEGIRLEIDPTIAAVSSLLIGLSVALLLTLWLLRGERG